MQLQKQETRALWRVRIEELRRELQMATTVVLSAGDRLLCLRERVKEQFGKIDEEAAIHLMDRPVAMKSNLHNVLFVPEKLLLHVAHASHKKPAAECPSVRLDLAKLLEAVPGLRGAATPPAADAKAAAENSVPAVLELGGKCPNIAFADCDLDLTATGVAGAIFQNAGQTCSAGSRLLVERSVHAPMIERLAARAKAMTLGPGMTDPDMGPIITERQLRTVEDYVEIGRREGARVVTGGARPTDARLSGGYFYEPTLLDGVDPSMRVAQEEIFGPVLAIIPFDSLDDAADIANDSPYGLIAGIWTRDINKAMSLAQRIKAGQVYVNTYGAAGGVELPFGGYKKSGYGREKGLEALATYTQVKNVCVRIHRA